jgi:hypothetical protein
MDFVAAGVRHFIFMPIPGDGDGVVRMTPDVGEEIYIDVDIATTPRRGDGVGRKGDRRWME